jgi:putative flippase GtrA
VGIVITFVYLTITTVLADVLGVPFQLALAAGTATAVCVHFTLQRLFVWAHHAEFALGIGEQLGRYLLIVGTQYAITAISTSLLPGLIGVPVTFVYIATALTIVGINFLVFRNGIFHAAE